MGILTKYLPQFALKAPKKLFLPFNSPLWIFFEIFFSTNILRDVLYYHAKCQSISAIRTEVMVNFLFLDFRQSRTLIMGLLRFCSPLPIARESTLKK